LQGWTGKEKCAFARLTKTSHQQAKGKKTFVFRKGRGWFFARKWEFSLNSGIGDCCKFWKLGVYE
jgi:hypothetical protein